MTMDTIENIQSGFQFDNFNRNEKLVAKGHVMPKAFKTGTTIAGCIFKDGVVLGADTRATNGTIVADKMCSKVHYIQPNIYCCGAGTAADLEMTTKLLSSNLELHKLNTGRQVPLVAACRTLKQMLFRYQGHIGAYLVLGGVDKYGPHVYSVYAHGSSASLPFTTLGSGSLAAMSVLETRWKPDMELDDAKQLIRDAINGGVFNDLGSGNSIDLCIITKDGPTYLRPYEISQVKGKRIGLYDYPRGTTEVLSTTVMPIKIISETVKSTSQEDDEMDTA